MRKSSAVVALALLGSTGLLTACSEEIPTEAYQSLKECTNSNKYSEAQCKENFEQAKADALKNAPAYKTKEECAEEFGADKCQPTPSNHPAGGGNFMPMMMGFMMGRSMNGQQVYPQAVYQDRQRNVVTGTGAFIGNGFGSVKVNSYSEAMGRPATASPARTSTVARGFVGRSISVSS